jgi:hypothetical protein
MQNQESKQKFDDYTGVVLRAMHYVDLSYESVCQKMNAIIEHIHKGKNPFMIRWSDLESGGWLDSVEMMHNEMSWLEFSSDEDEVSQSNEPQLKA